GQIWYLTDALGSVYILTDNDGNVVEAYHYTIYGSPKVYASDSTSRNLTDYDNRILFTSREYVWQFGLYYYRFRWYAPVIGRFTSQDPAGVEANYNYVFASPTNFLDPLGLWEIAGRIDLDVRIKGTVFRGGRVVAALAAWKGETITLWKKEVPKGHKVFVRTVGRFPYKLKGYRGEVKLLGLVTLCSYQLDVKAELIVALALFDKPVQKCEYVVDGTLLKGEISVLAEVFRLFNWWDIIKVTHNFAGKKGQKLSPKFDPRRDGWVKGRGRKLIVSKKGWIVKKQFAVAGKKYKFRFTVDVDIELEIVLYSRKPRQAKGKEREKK
ncbi:MAG: hypothetical protein DRP82_02825, partial [Planctomycetota bacterium]